MSRWLIAARSIPTMPVHNGRESLLSDGRRERQLRDRLIALRAHRADVVLAEQQSQRHVGNPGAICRSIAVIWERSPTPTCSRTSNSCRSLLTPFTATGGIPPGWAGNPLPVNSIAALPAQSLNGNINTLLVNNVITTQVTPDLKFKASYRFYNYDNGSPEIKFADWMLVDAVSAKSFFAPLAPVQSISISYTKQNVGSELNWRPSREWNFGAIYGYERYDWMRTDVNSHAREFRQGVRGLETDRLDHCSRERVGGAAALR